MSAASDPRRPAPPRSTLDWTLRLGELSSSSGPSRCWCRNQTNDEWSRFISIIPLRYAQRIRAWGGSSRGGGLELSELFLLRFVGCDGNAAPVAARRLGAAGAQGAGTAHLGIEVHRVAAGFERLDLSGGTRDGVGSQVDADRKRAEK